MNPTALPVLAALAPLALVVALALPSVARAAAADAGRAQGDLAAQVLAIFTEKCAGCHSPQAKKIKKFGHVTDLAKLAGDTKLITPGNPEKSALLKTIVDGEMPPDDSDIAPLSKAQTELIRTWIAQGTPLPGTAAAGTGTTNPTTAATTGNASGAASGGGTASAREPARPQPSFFKRLGRWIGKFHPLAAHFPIALVMAAALAESLRILGQRRQRCSAPAEDGDTGSERGVASGGGTATATLPAATAGTCVTTATCEAMLDGTVRFSMLLGAAGALGTAALGWITAIFHTQGELLETHRWLGTTAAIFVVPVALIGEWSARRAARQGRAWQGPGRTLFRILLLASVAAISLAAHMGGLLVHGEDYFRF